MSEETKTISDPAPVTVPKPVTPDASPSQFPASPDGIVAFVDAAPKEHLAWLYRAGSLLSNAVNARWSRGG